MPRNRMLSQKWFRDEVFSELSMSARFTYFGLLTISDDHGNVEANPKVVRGQLFSLDDTTIEQVSSYIDEIVQSGLGKRYESAEKQFLQIVGWKEPNHLAYQRVDRPSANRNPLPLVEDSSSTQRAVSEGSETKEKVKVKSKGKMKVKDKVTSPRKKVRRVVKSKNAVPKKSVSADVLRQRVNNLSP